MFTGPSPTLHTIAVGLLGAAAAVFAVGAVLALLAARAAPERARLLGTLAGLVVLAPPMVGLACLGLVMEGLDLRPGHESDVSSAWPALLPTVVVLTAGAGFLAGLLAGARSVRTAAAVGTPMAVFSLLLWAGIGGLGLVAWRAEPEAVRRIWNESTVVRPFLASLTLFPLVGFLGAGFAASAGRSLRALLGLAPASPDLQASGPVSTAAAGRAAAAPAQPRPMATGRTGLNERVRTERVTADRTIVRPEGARTGLSRPLAPGRARRAPPSARGPAHALTRGLLVFLGTIGFLTGTCDATRPRARLVTSDPVAGTVLAAPPTMVTLAFSNALDPSSEIKVVRTVTVLPTGQELATGGTPVAEASGTAALSADGRALRVRLPDGSPGGLYYVRWTAVRAGSRVERFGDLYFGVGMAVPEHIVSSGVLDEHDPDAFDGPASIVGGVLLIALGLALPFLIEWGRGASTGRG